MLVLDNARVISAADLNNYLACEYLTTLDLKVLAGEFARPKNKPGQSELLSKLGDEHEKSYLQRLLTEGRHVTTIEHGRDHAFVV